MLGVEQNRAKLFYRLEGEQLRQGADGGNDAG
jgi:hypothetical protein